MIQIKAQMINSNTSVRISWEMRNLNTDHEFVGSVNEMHVNTVAQAVQWVMKQLPDRGNDTTEVDQVIIDEVGNFADDDGCPMETRRLATYDPHFDIWEFTEYS